MHLIFRTLLHSWRSRHGPRIDPREVARTEFRVVPTDLDILRHMNNGVYLSILDLGRMDMLIRAGLWKVLRDRGWYPVVASETVTFRKSLTLWQRFTVESRVLGLDDKAVYLEQRFVVGGEIYAQAFIRGRFLKRTGGTVSPAELQDAIGVRYQGALPEWIERWGADVALPATRAEAPSHW